MNDSPDDPETLDPDESLALEAPDDFWMGYEAAIAEACRLVRALVVRTQHGGELRYPDVRQLEAELLALLEE